MFRRAKHWLWLILCWFMLAGHVWAMPCDVDDDGDIDRDDLNLIQQAILARAPVSGPNDPRDPDSNSRIDSIDGRLCALRCTRARCGTINQPPFANAGPDQSVRVGGLVALSGAASSDPDGDPLRYLWTLSNRPLGSLASLIDAATVAPHFIADKPGQYLIQLIVNDGKADSAADTVTVSTENSRPIANAGPDQSVRVGTLVSLNGGGSSDVDGDPLRYTWQLGRVPPGSGAMLSNPDGVSPTLLIDRPGNYLIALTVSDATLSSLPDTVAVSTENSPPVANAGANQAIPLGGSIALDGSRSSDVDGDPLTFRWSLLARPAGSQAVLSDATAVSPRFIADYPGTYVAQLIVNDGSVDSAPASVSLSTANAAPVANAGPDQTVLLGSLVSLDGSASHDPEGALVIYNWSLTGKPVGSHATLNDSNSLNPGFSADLPGDYIVQLIVNDGALASAPDTVTISTANSRPVADAGPPQNVAAGTSVRLDGRASHDVDGDLLSFAWSLTAVPAGSGAMLSAATTANPGFTPDIAGTYVAQLIVRDGRLDSLPVTVVITVSAANRKPLAVAQAIPTSAPVGSTVLLMGSDSSDPDNDPLTWAWSIVFRPDGSLASIVSPSASQTSFVPDVAGSYTIQLLVNDGKVDSAPALVVVEAQVVNQAPIAQDDSYQVEVDLLTVRPTVLYGVNSQTTPDVLYRFDKTTGVATPVGPIRLASGAHINVGGDVGLTYDPYSDRLYLVDGHVIQTRLMIVDPATGITEFVGAGIGVATFDPGLAYDPYAKRLYMVTEPGESAGRTSPEHILFEIDLATGAATRIGTMITTAGNVGLAFNWRNRQLYATFGKAETTALYRIDVNSGAATLVGSSGARHLTGLAYDPQSDTLFASDSESGRLYGLDPTTGAASLVGAYGLNNVEGLAVQADLTGKLTQPTPGVLGNDSDPDGDALTAILVSGPANGTVELKPDGTLNYVPNSGFFGTDTFSYRVSDGTAESNIAWASVTVLAANHPPAILSAGIAPKWTQLAPTGTAPSLRSHVGSAYDLINDRLIVFGGQQDGGAKLNDVWVLVNATGAGGAPAWAQLTPAGGPPAPRHLNTAVYDPTANRLIIHGGCPSNCGTAFVDTWVLTHANGLGGAPEWIQLPSGSSDLTAGHAYDPISNRLILFGGLTPAAPFSDTSVVRVLVDANGIGEPRWIDITPIGTPPPPRSELYALGYDAVNNRLLVFGGYRWRDIDYNDVWVLKNANGLGGAPEWQQLAPEGAPPDGRANMPSHYDPNSNRLIIFGGMRQGATPDTVFDDTWVLSSANGLDGTPQWTRLAASGTGPGPRRSHATVYDPRSNRVVAALGYNDLNGETFNDAWVLSNASGNCTAGQACTFKATASDPDAGDMVTYSLDAAPAGMVIDAANGAIVWTPVVEQIGNQAVTVRATDHGGLFATQAFTATVAPVAVPNVVGLAPEWAESFITAADLTVGTKTSQGGGVTLNFDSLPSKQGWTYRASGNFAREDRVFSVVGQTLVQDSIGVGFAGQGHNSYDFLGVVAQRLPLAVQVYSRIVAEEGGNRPYGFCFEARTDRDFFDTGLGLTRIADAFLTTVDFNTAQFHQYQLNAIPGVGYRLLIDGQLVQTGKPKPLISPNQIILGDCTGGTNARAEVTAYSFTQPRVVGQNPPAGTLMPNRTAVDLTIVDGPATETVPNILGLSQPAAEAAILAANLKVGGITSAPHPTIPAGQVSDQSPLPNIHVPKDTPVAIVMSTGPPGPVNVAPVITSMPVLAATAGQPYAYQVTATDANVGDVLTFSLPIAPVGMAINPATGLIAWTPTLAQIGNSNVTVRVTDAGGLFAEQGFILTVATPPPTNQVPSIASTPLTATVARASYSYDVDATDPDPGDALAFALPTAPSGMTINATTGLIAWTPTLAQVGDHSVVVRVTDTGGLFAEQSFTITVSTPPPTNQPPSINSTPLTTATADTRYSYDVDASDPDVGEVLTYSLTTAPAGMSIDAASGLVEWTPSAAQTGDHPVEVKVQDAGGLSATQPFTITVAAVAVCTPPPAALISWWPGEDNALDRAAANDGSAENGPTFAPGLVGQAFRFNGLNDLIRIASSRTTSFGGAFSVEFWFNPTTTIDTGTPNQVLLAKGRYTEGGFNAPVAIQVLGGDGRLLVRMPPAPALVSTTTTWPAGTWQHIALSWDGAHYRLYVNGIEEAGLDNAFSIIDSTDEITLGNADGFAAAGFAGLVDEAALYNRALSAAEVAAVHAARGLGKCTATYSRADAGPDQAVGVATTVTLDGSVSRAFDGAPLSYQWTLATRPASSAAVLSDASAVNPTFVADQAGVYTLELVVNNTGRASAPDSVSITAAQVNHAPTISSTPITAAAIDSAYSYPVIASDPDVGDTLSYSLPIAPAGMSIDAASGLIQWTPVTGQVGSHNVSVRVQDAGGLFALQPFVLVAAAAPVPVSVPNVVGQEQAAAQSVLTAAALGVGAVATASSESVAVGHVISQDPAAGTLVHSDSAVNLVVSSGPPGMSVASIRVTPIAPLILTGQTQAFTATGILSNGSSRPLSSGLVWASSNPAVASIDAAGVATALSEGSTTISVSEGGATGSTVFSVALATADDSTLPVAAITSPADGVGVVAAVPIVGTASDANFLKYVLEIAPFETGTFSTLAVGTTPVTDGTLATLDPTTLVNDLYVLRLTVIDRADNRSQTEITVQLNRDKKVGNFTLAFQDLNVPMAGIPISVVRSYDSRDKSLGDFGIGWRLDVQSLRLRVIGVGGQGWEQIRSGGVLSRRYTISPTRLHKVAITLPDGKVEEFDLTVSPSSQGFVPILVVDAVYSPRALTRGSLRALGDTRLVTFGAVGAIDLLTESGLEVFNPQEFEYTTAEGQVVLISRVDGVRQIRDRSGNTVSFSATGITHSAGKSISFSRDAQNRITSVTDPNGHVQNYSYDINGDLASHTDAEGRSTGFLYNYDHGLIEIRDPRGVRPIRNEYDDAGRLIKTIDAYGKEISYTHDLGANREVITDRLGNATIHVYDDQGNVTQTADALGGVTNRSYDARGNTLSEQDPLGRTRSYTYDGQDNRLTETDPLGKTATYRYNGNRQVLSVIDALGRTTSNTYDAAGNLTSSTDPAGNVTSYSYDSRGLQLTRTDSLGKLSSYAYDASGNLTTETDALNRVTTYTYDANGNRLTQSTTRSTAGGSETLLTSFVYDRDNRLTQTTNPDGSVTRIAYNAIGKQSLTTDQLGRETKYDYDDMGRLIKTTYPDGRSETSAYDAEGRRISSTDRAGRTSASTYDALGRLTASTAPDGTTTSTAYDAAGQVVSSTDARGNATAYSYDAAGRRTQVTDAVGSITTFSYDDAGNQTRVTDANGNAVAFTYDANNRRTRTTYADSTFDQVSYDALGRQVTKTDQAGKTTQFAYDALGRLISVTDALGQITRYTYDELGNQLTQTDAEGRSTSFAYDRMGRRTTRTLPLGQSESMSYDAAGNLRTKADFNGRTTTYAYDTLNRLLSKTPDASLGQPPVVFTYTASGQRASMQDASGSTTYSYDNRDRLLSKATPQGTLNYSYDAAGNLTNIHSNHSGGAAMDYAYDARNRLASVTDANGSTTYSYDAVGNLAGFLYPNGVQTSYTYNTLNRLTNVTGAESGTLASYTYTLGPTGNRTAVTEASGRQVDYSYDDLYRLKSETISADPTGPNGAITYTYDKVGNRLTRSSTVAVIPDQSFAYDFNDRLDGEGYDDNGNTLTSGSRSFGYDFENHLVTANGGVSFVYNGDGIRVAKTAGGVTTGFLVDDRNPTGYAQVLEEIVGGSVAKSYTYGLKLVSQKQASGVSFYGFDGHGSVRYLTDASGGVTDTYFYEGFGNMVGHTGSAASTYLYAGETRDEGVALDYLRARYYDFARGRFLSRDQYEGKEVRPQTFHKYIYGHADPVNNKDPSGLSSLFEISVSIAINQITTKSLLAAYYSRHFAFLRKGSEIVHCELQPQYHRKNFALAAISNGFVDPAVIDTYNDSSEKIIAGLNHLARAARDVYAPDFFDLLTSPLELSRLSTNTTHYDRIVDHGTEWMGNIELRKYWGYAKILSTLGKATLRMYRDMQTLGSNRFEGCRRTRYANYVYDVWSGLSDFIKENGDISADPDWVAQYTYFQFNPGP
jgi:RHS repeat-associated protein